MSWLKGIGARARLLFGRGSAESRMEEEIRFHLEMEKDRLEKEEGFDSDNAYRRARVVFGGCGKFMEEMRDGRGLAWLSGLRLDVKLGFRMLAKYPMLTLVGGISITVATAVGVGATEFVRDFLAQKLPLEDGGIVRLYQIDSEAGRLVPPSLYDLEVWRESVSSLEDLGAFKTMEQGLLSDISSVGRSAGVL